MGTPTHLVDESGHIAWHAHATLWGTTTWNPDATAYTPLRFPGQYHDLETGHHYNLHLTADEFPAIRVFERNGSIYTLDNRRLHVFQEAGVDIKFARATPQEIQNEGWKFTTRNDGNSINVRRR
ncbi:hypothetical protein [Streptomyces sp. NBC_01285]|uniref:hypothetical protein n=1 Tax=Streptomyces sp. NBC_01285 TaxID=2903813 RepID=UPI002257B638|nr:hypothetical protein [Streptomyces sp. NBC_01285]MCX4770455.1 hypothetical protein [Streptomyces sp. NBC_01285]